VAKKAGEALWEALQRRLRGKPAAEEVMEGFRGNPQDKRIQAALEWQLEEALKANRDFLDELYWLLEEVKKKPLARSIRPRSRAAVLSPRGRGRWQLGSGVWPSVEMLRGTSSSPGSAVRSISRPQFSNRISRRASAFSRRRRRRRCSPTHSANSRDSGPKGSHTAIYGGLWPFSLLILSLNSKLKLRPMSACAILWADRN